MEHISFFRLFILVATTSILLRSSKAAYSEQNGINFLRDQLPQSNNYVILKLNDVDKIKVPIPTGGMAGHFSLLDLTEPEAEGTARLNEDSQGLYYLKQVKVMARSGPQPAHCIFTRSGAQSDGMGEPWPRVNFREWSFNRKLLRKEAYFSDVWCVAKEERVLKILTDPPPPPQPSTPGPTSVSAVNLVPIVHLAVRSSDTSANNEHAFTKLVSEDGELPRVDRAALFYQIPYMVCRPIVYDGWPSRPLYQGLPLSVEADDESGASIESGIYVFAYYCDNWTSYGYYMASLFRTNWDPDWTSGDPNFSETRLD